MKVSNWYLKACWKKSRKLGRTDGRTDGHCHSIIRPFFKRAYKNHIKLCCQHYACWKLSNVTYELTFELLIYPYMKYHHNQHIQTTSSLPILSQCYISWHSSIHHFSKSTSQEIYWTKHVIAWVATILCMTYKGFSVRLVEFSCNR